MARCVAPPAGGRTVVAIDDDPVELDLVEAVLGPQGWSVVRASGGEEGVRVVARERPAVVLLDLLMPDVDGFEVVERLRADPRLADVPIVVLTSKDMTAADRERLRGRISVLAQQGHLPPGPARRRSSGGSAPGAPASRRARHERRALILIVEDNPRNLKLVRDVLDHVGYRTLEARDGRGRASRSRASSSRTLILMDIQLPGMDGVEALGAPARRARRRPASASSPLTAFAMKRRPRAVPRRGLRRLPREADRRARAPAPGRRADRRPGGDVTNEPATILVVDDLPQNVRLLEAVLAPRGYTVVAATSGRRGARAARRAAPSTSSCSTS